MKKTQFTIHNKGFTLIGPRDHDRAEGSWRERHMKSAFTLIKPKAYDRNEVSGREMTRKAAFTLIELIVVMAVIGILVLLAAPKFLGYTEQARDTQIKNDVKVVETLVAEYLIAQDELPSDWLGIGAKELSGATLIEAAGEADSIEAGEYRILPPEFLQDAGTILGNRFFANNLGKVYYEKEGYDFAENANPDGLYTYVLTGGESMITGYTGTEKQVAVPKSLLIGGATYPVTNIGINAFEGKGLTEAVIPDSVTFIDDYAFANNDLAHVRLGESIQYIGGYSFDNNELTQVQIPNVVEEIATNAFSNNLITKLVLGDSLVAISSGAFQGNHLERLSIPDNVVTISGYAFSQNRLMSVNVGTGIRTIGANAFTGNKLLPGAATLDIAQTSTTGISSLAFRNNGANGLTTITPTYLK